MIYINYFIIIMMMMVSENKCQRTNIRRKLGTERSHHLALWDCWLVVGVCCGLFKLDTDMQLTLRRLSRLSVVSASDDEP